MRGWLSCVVSLARNMARVRLTTRSRQAPHDEGTCGTAARAAWEMVCLLRAALDGDGNGARQILALAAFLASFAALLAPD